MIGNGEGDGQWKFREDVGLMSNFLYFDSSVLEKHIFRHNDPLGELANVLSWVSRSINDSMDATGALEERKFEVMSELFQYANNTLEGLEQELATLKQEVDTSFDTNDDVWAHDETVDETGMIADALFGELAQGDDEEDLRKLCEEIDRKCAEASGSKPL